MRLKPLAAGQRTAINPEGRTPIPSKPPAAATKSSPRPPPPSRTASEFASATHPPPHHHITGFVPPLRLCPGPWPPAPDRRATSTAERVSGTDALGKIGRASCRER